MLSRLSVLENACIRKSIWLLFFFYRQSTRRATQIFCCHFVHFDVIRFTLLCRTLHSFSTQTRLLLCVWNIIEASYLGSNVTVDCRVSVRRIFLSVFTILFHYVRFNCRYDLSVYSYKLFKGSCTFTAVSRFLLQQFY